MSGTFTLAACAEMLWRDRPMQWRLRRLTEMGFQVGLWNWPDHDLDMLEKSGATFSIMNGYLRGRLADDEGAAELLKTAKETVAVGKRLGVARLNLHGTGLGDGGLPVTPCETITGAMWLKARDTLNRIADLAEKEDVTFTLENLNLAVDHPGVPFARAEDTLALVSSVEPAGPAPQSRSLPCADRRGEPDRTVPRLPAMDREIQVADVPGRMEPGTGEINYRGVARALKDMGYRGPVGMEAFASGDPEAALQAFREAFTV